MIAFICHTCGRRLEQREGGAVPTVLACPGCARRYESVDGVHDLLDAATARQHRSFVDEYAAIRRGEGRGADDPAHYLALPATPQSDPHHREWNMRAESMRWLREQLASAYRSRPLRVVDAGAGNCWLSRHLAEWGHEVLAIDLNLDAHDGLRAGRHYLEHLPVFFDRARSDFERLPLASGTFDVVVFNGAFHYARDMRAVLAEAARVLAPGGRIVIIDSPIYRDYTSGVRMVEERAVRGRATFLTFDGLRTMAAALGLRLHVDVPSLGLLRAVKRRLTQARIGREIATMGRVTMMKA